MMFWILRLLNGVVKGTMCGLVSIPEGSLYQTVTVVEPGKVRQRSLRTVLF
jgi:hypothetical protein